MDYLGSVAISLAEPTSQAMRINLGRGGKYTAVSILDKGQEKMDKYMHTFLRQGSMIQIQCIHSHCVYYLNRIISFPRLYKAEIITALRQFLQLQVYLKWSCSDIQPVHQSVSSLCLRRTLNLNKGGTSL